MGGRIGFVTFPIKESIPVFNGDNLAEKHKDKQTAIKLFHCLDHLVLHNYHNMLDGASTKSIKCEGMCHKFGDRYALLFDFEERNVSCYYNDTFVDIIHDDLPDKVVPAMSLYTDLDKKAKVVCTKWEIV